MSIHMEQYDDLKAEIKELETQLAEKKKEYRELKTAGLRAAIEAQREAEKHVRAELDALGYKHNLSYYKTVWPTTFNF